ncbi:MAG: tRNA epoxyqueuosine(34) reductase QueG [Alphaproteobacteria bacterium]|nr:tRNA epoxyqueuosine(34) reductase QueG [Alphaproteobacteria bacterium]
MHDPRAADPHDLALRPREALLGLARAHGFHHARLAQVGPTPHGAAFEAWLAAGHAADMGWMRHGVDVRLDPRRREATARTALVLAVEHHHRRPPDPGGRTGLVARYAWGRDYHNLVGKRLKRLASALRTAGVTCWGGVDTAPVLERSWAAEAGLGFTGKSSVQILPARTSWMVLGVLFVDLEAEPDRPLRDHCGTCRRCLDACPTEAFVGPRSLDAGRCIAYWTIEAAGLPPLALRPGFGRWVFGCDVCQEVCPHNAAAPDPDEADLAPRHAWLDLDEVVASPDDALLARFTGTPLRRPGAAGLKRNALLALGNLGDPGGVDAARLGLSHPSPVVRGAAVWALARLEALPVAATDPDSLVQAEILAAREGRVPPATPLGPR